MIATQTRKSWDTSIKHYYRLGLEGNIPIPMRNKVSSSNKFRWKNEKENKYEGCSMSNFIQEELLLIKRIGQNSRDKNIIHKYLKLADTLHEIIKKVKGVKSALKNQKELIVNTLEDMKDIIPINDALHFFNISRATYQNYKSLVIHKCNASYFNWCTRKYPNQLLTSEIEIIKTYMTTTNYMFWAKSSVYLKAVRDKKIHFGRTSFYKYCNLLGFENKPSRKKRKDYKPLKTSKPNEVWCADVTVFKTADGVKHHIHILMDHYSKMVLGYETSNSSRGIIIRDLLAENCNKYQPKQLNFLSDDGSENVNAKVASFINSLVYPAKHIIAQKDVIFSNSMIEAFNKVIKHQFLYPLQLQNGKQLLEALEKVIPLYNTERPQSSLEGNTPLETYNGKVKYFNQYTSSFKKQRKFRIIQNKESNCYSCK